MGLFTALSDACSSDDQHPNSASESTIDGENYTDFGALQRAKFEAPWIMTIQMEKISLTLAHTCQSR